MPRQSNCEGYKRHWFSVHGQAYLRSPVCVRCGAPNPRPLIDNEVNDLVTFNAVWPGAVGQHVVNALREMGQKA